MGDAPALVVCGQRDRGNAIPVDEAAGARSNTFYLLQAELSEERPDLHKIVASERGEDLGRMRESERRSVVQECRYLVFIISKQETLHVCRHEISCLLDLLGAALAYSIQLLRS